MSIFTKIASFVVPPQVKIILELAPYVIILGLLMGLEATRGTLDKTKDQYKVNMANEKVIEASNEKHWSDQLASANQNYATTIAKMNPVILNSIDTGKAYAQTTAGKQPCLTSARVQSILASRNAEFAKSTASSTRALRSGGIVR